MSEQPSSQTSPDSDHARSEHDSADGEFAALRAAVQEVEAHAAAAGWDRPAQVFALVDTADLLRHEPQLASVLGVDADAPTGLTPVEQESAVESLEQLLPTIAWPPEVDGCAVVLEASTEPPDADAPTESEARVVAGVLRSGESWCAIRQRAHDDDTLVLGGEDLVPTLLELLHATFVPDAVDGDTDPEGPTESHHE